MPEIFSEDSDIVQCVNTLHKLGDWESILDIRYKNPSLLWAWPTESSLRWLGQVPFNYQTKGITSIGCGSGLLEWLIETSTKCPVTSIDLAESWWAKYNQAPSYISRIWIDQRRPIDSTLLSPDTALLFCYFNNENAFSNYINAYEGNVVIIVGPKPGLGRHTSPMPLTPNFDSKKQWELKETFDFNENGDIATVWVLKN